jgi:predicted cupin superfamily sugar epimerase
MTPEDFSAIHRVKSDELFYFHAGDPVEMTWLLPSGEWRQMLLGNDVLADQLPQVCVPHGVWQGTRLLPGGSYALLSCAVSPGFEYADFELGPREALLAQYPAAREAIMHLTRPGI